MHDDDQAPEGFELLPSQYSRSFVALIGPFHVRREDDGNLRIGVRLRERHCNPFGEAHGGFIAAMADFVCAYTMLQGPDPTPTVVTIQLSTQMIASARLGAWVEGRSSLRRKGRTIAHVGCDFYQGETLLAHADAVFRVLSERGVAARFERHS
jgi:uncharacterized protein (TIGR00369 family)